MVTSREISTDDIRLESLEDFLLAHRYVFRERWGEYLNRYSRKPYGREESVFVPTTIDIADFSRRSEDLVSTLSIQLKLSPALVLKSIANAGYESIRIIANEGEHSNTLSYDAAIDLLQGGFALIDSSAVLALSDDSPRLIRGRRPDVVRSYLNSVRVGQTEVGSFVLTLLMPIGARNIHETFAAAEDAEIFGSRVALKVSRALEAAHEAVSGKMALRGDLHLRGLTANFSGGLARMVEAVGNVAVSVEPPKRRKATLRRSLVRFTRNDAVSLRQIQRELTPAEERHPLRIVGTVTEFKEPKGKVSGTIVVSATIFGENRPVRIKYNRNDRETVLKALERKGEFDLEVAGELIRRGGHFVLQDSIEFSLIPKILLT